MSTIAFCMLSLTGHLNPSFTIAERLKERGHRIFYLSIPDWIDMGHSFADHIRSLGFGVVALAPQAQEDYRAGDRKSFNSYFSTMEGDVQLFVEEFHPSLFVVDALLPPIALKSYELGIPTAMLSVVLPRRRGRFRPPLLTTIIPSGTYCSRMKIAAAWQRSEFYRHIAAVLCRLRGKRNLYQLTKKMAKRVKYAREQIHYDTVFSPELGMPELITCTPDFDFPVADDNYHYIGFSVDLKRDQTASVPFPWGRIVVDAPLIFCTLGSESVNFTHSRRFFQTVIDAFAAEPEWQLVMAVGNRIETKEFQRVPANVILVNWAPHLEILKRSSLMINHGGLGTVKECILSGVPMIVFPSTSDQPGNAARVVYHGLGIAGNIGKISAPQLREMIKSMLHEPSYKVRTERMGQKFSQMETADKGVEIIEKLIAANSARDSDRVNTKERIA